MTLDLDVLQAAAEAASPGPWMAGAARFGYDHNETPYVAPRFGTRNICQVYSEVAPADAEFIAAANPAVVLELVAAHRAALARIARVEAYAQELREMYEYRARVIEGFSNSNPNIAAEHRSIARSLRRDLEDLPPLTEGEPSE